MKKSFLWTFVMTVLGAIIGAGFASGKEIASFFGKFGLWSIPFLFLSCCLFFFCFYVFANLGKDLKPKSISDITSKVFGKAGIFVDFAFILSTFITLSSMLAGCDSIGVMMFENNYNFCYISIFTAMIVTIIVSVGLKYIYKITDVALPIMLSLIMIVILLFFIFLPAKKISNTNINNNIFSATLNTFLYVAMNTFFNVFIISKTSQYMNRKQVKQASFISAFVLLLLLVLIMLAIFHGGDLILASDMPMLAIANSIGGVVGKLYSIVLYFAIFTTICLSAYTLVEWLNRYVKNKFVCCVVVMTLGFVFSRFGFSTIVDVFYPIEGIFGLFFIVYVICYYFRYKSMSIKEYNSFNKKNSLDSDAIMVCNMENKTSIKKQQKKKNNISGEVVSLKVEKKGESVTITKKYSGCKQNLKK